MLWEEHAAEMEAVLTRHDALLRIAFADPEVVAVTCTDAAREAGLIKPPVEVAADATDTERLMAAAGRASYSR